MSWREPLGSFLIIEFLSTLIACINFNFNFLFLKYSKKFKSLSNKFLSNLILIK